MHALELFEKAPTAQVEAGVAETALLGHGPTRESLQTFHTTPEHLSKGELPSAL